MRLDPDCVRDILLVVEALEFGSELAIKDLKLALPSYSEEQLRYHCRQLYSSGFIDALVVTSGQGVLPSVARVYDLMPLGHQFLADIRSDKIWADTKQIAASIGSTSLDVLSSVASKILTNIIAKHLSL